MHMRKQEKAGGSRAQYVYGLTYTYIFEFIIPAVVNRLRVFRLAIHSKQMTYPLFDL